MGALLALPILIGLPMAAGAAEADNYKAFFQPLPDAAGNPDNPLNDSKIALGKMLFLDGRLSKSGFISCNSCHNLATGGVDNLPTSIGHGWQLGPRNAPTVLNAALHFTQFWDGRAKDVEEQAQGPVLNPKEMAATKELVLDRIKSIPEYVALFSKAFPGEKEPLTYENIAKAIAAFERTLLTPSRFDRFLKGDDKALTADEKKGLKLVVDKGCIACHRGPLMGGNSFQKLELGDSDMGRFEATKNDAEKKFFKVPTWRNVALTYPYFHDGSVWTLEEAVRIMGEKQLKIQLADQEVADITAFLKSLTGEKMTFDARNDKYGRSRTLIPSFFI
ncbi:MAG: cytochrome-c peroxidase [Nitrospirae bacterium]|nr:cytochrome-c peroxidase [Nitrospirota bacterium]